jgi:hypothetical protein
MAILTPASFWRKRFFALAPYVINVPGKDGKKTLRLGDELLGRIELLAFVLNRDQTDIIRQVLNEGIRPLEEKHRKQLSTAARARKEACELEKRSEGMMGKDESEQRPV